MNNRKKAILVAMALLCLNFGAIAQTVSLKMKNVSVKEAMTQLKNKSGYSFVYEAGDLDTKKIVNVDATQLPEAVEQILAGQNVSFEVKDKNIVVSKGAKRATEKKRKTIKGTVKDANGEPVIGATVMIKGISNGTITDFDANFSLDVVSGEEIEISYIGYKTQVLKPGNRDFLSVTLLEDTKILDEVVVVGYGKQSEKLLTTSISSMKVDEIDQGNDYNVAKMLQGRTPGVNVSTASGIPGEQPNVRVRGVASISGDATPLYVVDCLV